MSRAYLTPVIVGAVLGALSISVFTELLHWVVTGSVLP